MPEQSERTNTYPTSLLPTLPMLLFSVVARLRDFAQKLTNHLIIIALILKLTLEDGCSVDEIEVHVIEECPAVPFTQFEDFAN